MPQTIEPCPDLAAAERRLSELLQQHREQQPLARINILVGSALQRLYHQRRLARQLGPLAAVYFFTPADLAKEIADRTAATAPRTPLPPGAAPLLLDDILHNDLPSNALQELDPDSPGLPEALHTTFTDLREGGVPPQAFAHFAAQRPANADDRRILHDLAAIYQHWIDRVANLRDRASLYEDALQAAPTQIAAALANAPLIVAGIYDFTRVQRQLLDRCAEHVEVHILLPAPPGDEHATNLANALGAETNGELIEPPPAQTETAAIAGFSAADPRAEAAETARRLLDAAEQGIKFHEMAVLHRGGPAADARLADAIQRAGAPVFLAGGQPVLHTSAGRAALHLLELLCETPQRARLLEFLGNPALRPRLLNTLPPKPLQWERISRNAGLTSEWPEFQSHLQRHIDTLQSNDDPRPYEQQAAAELLQVCADLQRRADQIAQADNWSEAVQVVTAALADYLHDGSGAADHNDHNDQPDHHEYRRLIDAIRDPISKVEGIDKVGARYTPARLKRAALGGLAKARLRPAKAFNGVLIGNAAGASRTLRFDALFVAGMAERSFPAVPRQDPLLPDSARTALNNQLGAQALRLGQTRTRQDRFLFTLLEQAARRRLTLSYARRAAAVGGPAHPSVLLMQALQRAQQGAAPLLDEDALNNHDQFQRLPAAVSEATPRLNAEGILAWGAEQRALDHSDLRLALLSAPGVNSPGLLVQIGGDQAKRAETARWHRSKRHFSPFDGKIQPPGELWNPFDGERTLSATALERYAACPYRFFLANILGLRAVSEPEEGGELSALDRGSLIHSILEAWVQHWLRERSPAWPEYARDPAPLLAIANRQLDQAQQLRQLGGPGIAEGLRRQVLDDLELARQEEAKRAAMEPEWQPHAVEFSFDDVELPAGGGRAITVAGRIDRVDAAPGQRRRAIDYKTGKQRRNAADAFRAGGTMQLPLYLHALADAGGDLAESSAELFYVTRKGNFARDPLEGAALAARGAPDAPAPADELEHVLEVITDGIVDGNFFPFPFKTARKDLNDKHCQWCQFENACNPKVAERYKYKQRSDQALTAEFEKLVAQRSRQ